MTVGSRVRMLMTMRAVIQRNTTATTDGYGHPEAPTWGAHGTFACRVWSKNRQEENDTKKTALVEDLRCSMPLDADVTEDDRIQNITDRQGVVLWAGPLRIDTIQNKHTHIECALRRVQS